MSPAVGPPKATQSTTDRVWNQYLLQGCRSIFLSGGGAGDEFQVHMKSLQSMPCNSVGNALFEYRYANLGECILFPFIIEYR